jgi:dolichol-phosphate mannosyltransferase
MTHAPDISVVVPVYGCRDCLEALVDTIRKAFEGMSLKWECVFVDDRGPDDPWPLIEELAGRDARVRGLRLARNHGQHLAIWAGFAEARGDWVAVIDCDLQDDPAVIPRLHEAAIAHGVEAMIVDRGSWSDSAFRRAASSMFYRFVHVLAGVRINNIGNFGLYSRRMIDTLLMFGEQEVFLPIMVSLTGLKTAQLQVDRGQRAAGESSYSFGRLLRLAIAIIIRFSDRPLKLSVIVGLAFSGLAALISVILVIGWLAGVFTVQGWTSTILSMWFLSGLIMAVLGVHGFYLGRVFAEVKNRPRILYETRTGGTEFGREARLHG